MAGARSERTKRDNARARKLGYKNYYDYRVHNSGRIPPDVVIPTGQRAKARGHRGKLDLLRKLRPGDLLIVPDGLGSIEKDERGRFKLVRKLIIDGKTGNAFTFVLRNLTPEAMADLIHAEQARGAIWSPSPSLDQRRLVGLDERPPPVDKRRANRALRAAGLAVLR